MNVLSNFIVFIFMIIGGCFRLILFSLTCLIRGSLKAKAAILVIYGGLICLFIYNRPVFYVIIAVFAIMGILLTFIMIRPRRSKSERRSIRKMRNPIFGNMSRKRAEKKYNKLMEAYRSGEWGENGFEKMLNISQAYSDYLSGS